MIYIRDAVYDNGDTCTITISDGDEGDYPEQIDLFINGAHALTDLYLPSLNRDWVLTNKGNTNEG